MKILLARSEDKIMRFQLSASRNDLLHNRRCNFFSRRIRGKHLITKLEKETKSFGKPWIHRNARWLMF